MKKALKSFFIKGRKVSDSITERYRYFRALLRHNHNALSLIAEMEQLYYSGRPFTLNQIRVFYEELLESITGLAHCLESMTGRAYPELISKIEEIDERLFSSFSPSCALPATSITLDIDEIGADMKRLVGSKALNLAILRNQLGLKVPEGFVITAYAFQKFLEHNNLNSFIDSILSGVTAEDYKTIEFASQQIQRRIQEAVVPEEILEAVQRGFRQLQERTSEDVMTAVRSSAVGEDTEATFAGQYDSLLNVAYPNVIEAYKTVLSSKYSARSINYRLLYGLDDKDTPMAVIVLEMVKAKASGVLYTVDPAIRPHCPLKVTSILGLGEHLVSGYSTPDIFLLDRLEDRILDTVIAEKNTKMVALKEGGTDICPIAFSDRARPSIDEPLLLRLRQIGLMIEEYFESAQDVEWAIDDNDELFLLQTRLLNVPKMHPEDIPDEREVKDIEPLLSGGETASAGIAAGRVFELHNASGPIDVEDDIILVAKNATPDLARYIGKVKGIITEMGSASSHLASVAREFGVPAVFGMRNAVSILTSGHYITLYADKARVYEGFIEELIKDIHPSRKMIFNSSVHKRMRDVLDLISPLNLTDPNSKDFQPSKAQTFHDIIRYTHEVSVREIFGIGDISKQRNSAARRLKTRLPLNFWIIDILKRDDDNAPIEPLDIDSVPFRAVWQGFIHPGVNWEGTMGLNTSKISTLFAVAATSELGEQPGGDSYAIVAEDYINMSIKFAYHFATIDALCGDLANQNYVSLQFSGGAGSYYGKSLRVQLMGNVLSRLGFHVEIKGDLIEAVYARFDKEATINALDHLGRLLASCRLLDITISNQDDIEFYTNQFFKGNYDFINIKRYEVLPSFYVKGGVWKAIADEQDRYCMYDGSHSSGGALRGITNILNKFLSNKQRAFIESIESQHHLPLAIAKGNILEDCCIDLKIKLLSGKTDRTGGIAFGLRDVENYLAFGLEANEGCVSLFSVSRGRRTVIERKNKKIDTGIWHNLRVEVSGAEIRGYLNNTMMVRHTGFEPINGYCGLWAKGDSVIIFDALIIDGPLVSMIIEG